MERFAGDGKMLPEQVWDSDDIPSRELYFGRPSGSAMPLAWAHAEYIKLRRSLAEGRVFDLPIQTWQRYVVDRTDSRHAIWRVNHRRREMPAGKALRIMLESPAVISWQADGQSYGGSLSTRDAGMDIHYADLPTDDLPPATTVTFRFDGPQGKWISRRDWFVSSSGEIRITEETPAREEARLGSHR